MMTNFFWGKKLLAGASVVALIVLGVTAANAEDRHGRNIRLSDRPKTIVIDNLDTAILTKGDPAAAAIAQGICGDCHSTDYIATQPKLSCKQWASEIVKMGNTFDAKIPWHEDNVTYTALNQILVYLAGNYGAGSASCDLNAVKAVPGLNP